jgi:hypothetical protein
MTRCSTMVGFMSSFILLYLVLSLHHQHVSGKGKKTKRSNSSQVISNSKIPTDDASMHKVIHELFMIGERHPDLLVNMLLSGDPLGTDANSMYHSESSLSC